MSDRTNQRLYERELSFRQLATISQVAKMGGQFRYVEDVLRGPVRDTVRQFMRSQCTKKRPLLVS